MIFATVFGYYVLKDEYNMPRALGGSGDFGETFREGCYPKPVPYLNEYFLIICGYHLGQLILHMCSNR